MLNILRLTDLTIVKARSPRSCARLLKWGVPRRAFRRVHRSSLTKDNRRSPKRKENWRKSLLLGIQTGNKLAKTPFFVALFSALPSLSQFGRGRLSLVPISFYALSLLFGSCRLSEFSWQGLLIGPVGWFPWRAISSRNPLYIKRP